MSIFRWMPKILLDGLFHQNPSLYFIWSDDSYVVPRLPQSSVQSSKITNVSNCSHLKHHSAPTPASAPPSAPAPTPCPPPGQHVLPPVVSYNPTLLSTPESCFNPVASVGETSNKRYLHCITCPQRVPRPFNTVQFIKNAIMSIGREPVSIIYY